MKMSDAMRQKGVDELYLASTVSALVNRLENSKEEKLLLEAIKECGKFLGAYSTQPKVEDEPVQIIIDVPRPDRTAQLASQRKAAPEERCKPPAREGS
jgi:hypothetical protein